MAVLYWEPWLSRLQASLPQADGIRLEVVILREAKRGFVLLPRRWVGERSFAWSTRCRRLVNDYERYATALAGVPYYRVRRIYVQAGSYPHAKCITPSRADCAVQPSHTMSRHVTQK